MKTPEEIEHIFREHNGFLKTNELYARRIFYNNIQKLIQDGLIEKIRYGYYQWVDSNYSSDVIIIKRLYPDGILCMNTALFFHGYSDRTPQDWHIAVGKDSSKSRFKLDYPFVKPYYVEPALLNIGLSKGDIDGNQVCIYDKERTICDCLRYEKKMDREIFNKAIMNYVSDSSKRVPILMDYARHFRITEKVKSIIGVWL